VLWVLGVVAFFTTSHSKLATYCLPVLPQAALLAAIALEDGMTTWSQTLSRWLGALLVLAAAATALLWLRLAHLALPQFGVDAELLRCLAALAFALLSALAAAHLLAPSSRRPAVVLGLGGVLAGLCSLGAISAASPLISAKALALAVKADARPADELWTYDSYLHGLQYYTLRPVDKLVYFVGEFYYAKRDAANAGRFGDDNDIRNLPRAGGRTFVAMKTARRAWFESVARQGAITAWRKFGPWSLAEVRAR
jgi:4-amino-4-deoxy-L-arabinose transferase-like glycosyltransferase